MKYVVSSFEEIAEFFDQRANNCLDKQKTAKPIDGKRLAAEAITWKNAADFIRNCEMKI